MNLLKKLTLGKIKSVVDFNNKDVLLKYYKHKFTKKELEEILYKSNVSDETLYKVLRETKNQEQIKNNINFRI